MKTLLVLLLLLPLLHAPAGAEGLAETAGGTLGLEAVSEALPDELRSVGGTLDLTGGYDGVGALERLWDRLLLQLAEALRDCAREAGQVFALCLLCAVGTALAPGQGAAYIQIGGCALLACLAADGLGSMTAQALDALQALKDYAGAALPVLYTAAAAGGAPAAASAGYALSCLALDLLMTAAQRLILPLLNGYLAMSVCAGIFDNTLLRSGIKLGKKLATLLMTGMTAAFTALLSLTGIVSGSTDALAVKTAKTVLSGTVPVVGRVISDAASSVVAAAALVKNSAGAFGLVAVCALCLAPFAALGVRRFLFSLAAAAAELTAGERMSRLLGDLSGYFGMLLGLIGSFGLMLFFCIVAAIRTVTG